MTLSIMILSIMILSIMALIQGSVSFTFSFTNMLYF